VLRYGREPGLHYINATIVEASDRIAQALAVEVGAPLAFVESVGSADAVPISLGANYFPLPRFAGIGDVLVRERSVTRALATYGVADYTRRITRVGARLPTTEEALLLRQLRTVPLIIAESVDIDGDGRPVSFNDAKFASERVYLTLEP